MTKDNEMHIPVLAEEVITLLQPKPNGIYIDATINGGGHARRIAERVGTHGMVVGIEWDPDIAERIASELKKEEIKNINVIQGNYRNIERIIPAEIQGTVRGILFDLGFSSYHIDQAARGFSFQRDEPLDMRYNRHDTPLTAEIIVNRWPQDSIADILRTYGEERFAKRIAREIARRRKEKKIKTTHELVEIIRRALPRRPSRNSIHEATRTFQALRIAVNNELENLEKGLEAALHILRPGGTLAVISFHSLEDRIVKHFFASRAKEEILTIITRKPITASIEEIKRNPRARSAKLRGAQKI